MDSDGVVTTPSDLKIVNNAVSEVVEVTSIKAEVLNDWMAVEYSDDFSIKEDNTKEFSSCLNNDEMNSNGDFA